MGKTISKKCKILIFSIKISNIKYFDEKWIF